MLLSVLLCWYYVDHNLRFYNFSDFTWVDLTYRPSVITLYVCYILAIRNLWIGIDWLTLLLSMMDTRGRKIRYFIFKSQSSNRLDPRFVKLCPPVDMYLHPLWRTCANARPAPSDKQVWYTLWLSDWGPPGKVGWSGGGGGGVCILGHFMKKGCNHGSKPRGGLNYAWLNKAQGYQWAMSQ